MTTTSTQALVIGGGMAGPVTAMALKKAGIDATVYEAYDRGADGVGAFLTLAVNGMAALAELDLQHLVRGKGFDTPRMTLSMNASRQLADFAFGDPLPDGTINQTIRRADLYGVLRDEAVRRGVAVEYGKRLVGATSTKDGVEARFADGTTATGDLLIGADGLRSATRRIIDTSAPDPRYVPLMNAGGYAKGVKLDAEPGVMHMIFAKRCFFSYVANPNGEVWWFANPRQERELSPAELAKIDWRGLLLEMFATEDIPATGLIEATEEIFSGWNTYDFPKVPVWHRDRMIIIGDAAHATSPASGQGASMAIEDAVTLAKCLRDLPDVRSAFDAYEGLRRKRVERIVAQGKRNGDGKSLGPVMRLLVPLFIKLNKPSADSTAWLYGHRVDWHTPVVS